MNTVHHVTTLPRSVKLHAHEFDILVGESHLAQRVKSLRIILQIASRKVG